MKVASEQSNIELKSRSDRREIVISDTNLDIDLKIKSQVAPTHDDKKKAQMRIKQLEKQQQLHLFNTIIKGLDIYTVTETGTYFDLNDLTPEQFWKLYYQINLTYDCIARNKFMDELLEKECINWCNGALDIDNWNERLDLEPDSITTNTGVVPYSRLRDDALNQCKYLKKESESMTAKVSSEHDSKIIDRSVYTDKRTADKNKR